MELAFFDASRVQASGIAPPSMASELLEQNDAAGGSKEKEEIIKEVTCTAYAGEYCTWMILLIRSLTTDFVFHSWCRYRQ